MRVRLIAVMVAILTLGQGLPASAASASTAGDLQAVITSAGTISSPMGVFHALRSSSNGGWNGFNRAGLVGMPSPLEGLAIAGSNGELHVLVTSTRGTEANLYHALRSADGRWNGFNNVSGPARVPASTSSYGAVAAAIVNGDLHVLLLTSGPNLYHAIRFASTGAWAGFNQVPASIPGNVLKVAATGVGGDLHVLIAMATGGGLYHAIRYSSNGGWNGFNNVANAARVPGGNVSVTGVAAATVGQDLHVVIKTNLEVLYHAIRISADGTWKGFNDVSGAARVPTGVSFPSVAVAGASGDLQVMVITNAGTLYHAVRSSSNGAWNGLNDVSCCATVPASPTAIAISGA